MVARETGGSEFGWAVEWLDEEEWSAGNYSHLQGVGQ